MNDTLLTAIITATVAVLIATGSGGFAFWRYLQAQERERQAKIVAEELIDRYPSGKIEAYLLENNYGKGTHVLKQKYKGRATMGIITFWNF